MSATSSEDLFLLESSSFDFSSEGDDIMAPTGSLSQRLYENRFKLFGGAVIILLTMSIILIVTVDIHNSKDVTKFLLYVEEKLEMMDKSLQEAAWKYNTDLSDENLQKLIDAESEYNQELVYILANAKGFSNIDQYTPEQQRKLNLLKQYGGVPLDSEKQAELSELISEMEGIYSKGTVDGKYLDPDLEGIMAKSRDYNELLQVWSGWRNAVGVPIGKKFELYVELMNIGAQDNGFDDAGKFWKSGYDMTTEEFATDIDRLWTQILPLYKKLHCYVRTKLIEHYGVDKIGEDGLIPAHLLGNMWAQDWSNIIDILKPYPDVSSIDVTDQLEKDNYNAVKMHELSQEFYESLGYDPLPDSFWKKSMLEKPDGKEAVCHASAWDFGNDDLRIKMCTKINQEDLLVIHHEQGHLYYDHYYKNQPYLFRNGANDGFHESIGDTIQLSVMNPSHLYDIGLLKEYTFSEERLINDQMQMALTKISFLPFGYLIDQWRWLVFSNEISPDNYNQKWWELRETYQGIKSPVQQDTDSFDAGAKYHVAASVPYMRYFIAHILQFQFHRSLCEEAGQSPIYQCSIYENTDAGNIFKNMLKNGASKPWQESLSAVTGQTVMDAEAIKEYFSPLSNWLDEHNSGKTCPWSD
eukprot:TRINITY_DN6212_c0_g1_i1.p1 TRINITY_DN6212_c0_g1~~TRINITY_DN6212_c0_g1_i1.p1  ORF type:complete len:638 (+),score=149.11 TRINITY_DN6212_c0_g1_i1:46-1959(+)